jgi:acetoacetyl-CoA synthetase
MNRMNEPLWTPSPDRIARANLTRFGQGRPYAELYEWSVTKPLEFWAAAWEFGGIRGVRGNAWPSTWTMPGAFLSGCDAELRGERPPGRY